MSTAILLTILLSLLIPILHVLYTHLTSPLRNIPGPKSYTLTTWRLAYTSWRSRATASIHRLHRLHGPVIRISPHELSFSSPTALHQIYGAGSKAERTPFYALFEPYGIPTMFTMRAGVEHALRKRALARVYAVSSVKGEVVDGLVRERVEGFLGAVKREGGMQREGVEVGGLLHFFTLDLSSAFIYGSAIGTRALEGRESDRALLRDFAHPFRRKLAWAATYGVPGWIVEVVLRGRGEANRPMPFSTLREWGKEAFARYRESTAPDSKVPRSSTNPSVETSLIAQLHRGDPPLTDLQIASECIDHLLAGIETTRNTLLMLLWQLSGRKSAQLQSRLRTELLNLSIPSPPSATTEPKSQPRSHPFLAAVVQEAQRLYAPLPARMPRRFPEDTVIDGIVVPAGTEVSIAPYTLHRDEEVFPDPERFDTGRWMDGEGGGDEDRELRMRNKLFWPFSSGARMCTGSHLATASMTALLAAIYSRYTTRLARERDEDVSPAWTSRFEIFWDEGCATHSDGDTCWIIFTPLTPRGSDSSSED